MNTKAAGSTEFIALMALAMSMVALSIDAMLPALSPMASELNVSNANDRQLVITILFLGMALGQLLYGPSSDAFGRRTPMILGVSIFIVGSVMSALSESFQVMLIGRFLQGIGAAAPRTICTAIIRDRTAGAEMARIMSLVMMVFILVPTIAPLIGQLILTVSHWRFIFWFFVAIAILLLVWFLARQPETLPKEMRSPMRGAVVLDAFLQTMTTRQTLINTLGASLVFGAFVGYLISSQQVLQEYFDTGEQFALYFGVLALSLGLASFINSKLVRQFGLRRLCRIALLGIGSLSLVFLLYCLSTSPSLFWFMVYLLATFLCIGTLFSNFNALAMEPMGHIAGMAASVTGSIQTLLSLSIGYVIGQLFNGTVIPMVAAFFVLSVMSLVLVVFFDRG